MATGRSKRPVRTQDTAAGNTASETQSANADNSVVQQQLAGADGGVDDSTNSPYLDAFSRQTADGGSGDGGPGDGTGPGNRTDDGGNGDGGPGGPEPGRLPSREPLAPPKTLTPKEIARNNREDALKQRKEQQERLQRQKEVADHGTMEILAHGIAYQNNPDPTVVKQYGYKAEVLPGAVNGFAATAFFPLKGKQPPGQSTQELSTPVNPAKPPVIAFRGTENNKKDRKRDDWNANFDVNGIGYSQFVTNEALILKYVHRLKAFGPLTSTGHSLGGALAQMLACLHPGLVSRVVTFQAPGIDKELINKLNAHNTKHKDDPSKQVQSTHHDSQGDIVSMGGQAHTPGNTYSHKSDTSDAHTGYLLRGKKKEDWSKKKVPDQASGANITKGLKENYVPFGGNTQEDTMVAEQWNQRSRLLKTMRDASEALWANKGFHAALAAANKTLAAQQDQFTRSWAGGFVRDFKQRHQIWLNQLRIDSAKLALGVQAEMGKSGSNIHKRNVAVEVAKRLQKDSPYRMTNSDRASVFTAVEAKLDANADQARSVEPKTPLSTNR